MAQVQPNGSAQAATEASDSQVQSRQARGFPDYESALAAVWPTQKPTRLSTTRSFGTGRTMSSWLGSWLQWMLSYFGTHNPLPATITGEDVLWLFDNVAYLDSSGSDAVAGSWKAEFVAATFRQAPRDERGIEVLPVLEEGADVVAKLIGLAGDAAERETVRRRLVPFFQEILPGRKVVLECGQDFGGQTGNSSSSSSDGGPIKERITSLAERVTRRASKLVTGDERLLSLGPGSRNGISSQVMDFPGIGVSADTGRVTLVTSSARVPEGCVGELVTKTLFAKPEGWGLISDIDDTIKVTLTSSPIGILRSTFVSEPEPIVGMPDLYAHIQQVIGPGAPVFYVSASPYNLYPFLRQFRDQFYPFGQIILRDASWQSLPGLLSGLTLGTQDYKEDRIRRLHGWLPRRKMICFGDSIYFDPETYGSLASEFPGWVRLICIRKATGVDARDMEAKNAPERFEKAFAGLPRSMWYVFEDPSECYNLVQEVVAQDP